MIIIDRPLIPSLFIKKESGSSSSKQFTTSERFYRTSSSSKPRIDNPSERSYGTSSPSKPRIDNPSERSCGTSSSSKPRIDNPSIDNPTIVIDDPIPEVTRKLSSGSFPMSIDDDKHSDDNSGPFNLVVDEDIISSISSKSSRP